MWKVVAAIGALFAGVMMIKFTIIGYTNDEFLPYLVTGVIGIGLLLAAQKLRDRELGTPERTDTDRR